MKIPRVRAVVESTPIPAAGVALGLVSLGNLLAPYSTALLVVLASCAAVLFALVIAKIAEASLAAESQAAAVIAE